MKLELPEIAPLTQSRDEAVRRASTFELSATALRAIQSGLEQTFGNPFTIIDAESGEIAFTPSSALLVDIDSRLSLLQEVARQGHSEIVEDEAPLVLLAVPLGGLVRGAAFVAVGVFLTERVQDANQIESAARVFGVDCRRALEWSLRREPWPPRILARLADTTVDNLVQRHELELLRREAALADMNARETFAELKLLHTLAENLNVSDDESVLWRDALQQLSATVPAVCLAAVECRDADDSLRVELADNTGVLTHGDCPVSKESLSDFVHELGPHASRRPLLVNRHETALPTWPCPRIREMICVPIEEGRQLRGWLLALNHRGHSDDELSMFGSVEIRQLGSVAAMLGVHGRNAHLYRKQSELFNSSVRALTSAIDAKDCYTSGHSDRVARIAVCLAEQLGMSKEMLDLIYLGGMLHDIGKIGIEDRVLNKPGRLTEEEFDQIKRHPEYGVEILREVQELSAVLPIVLHHHEAWNGTGYPHGLTGPETPLVARIVAVADGFDAMTSDRPYRPGMSLDEVEDILRQGAGQQWDPGVIAAFFAVRDRIYPIADKQDAAPSPFQLPVASVK